MNELNYFIKYQKDKLKKRLAYNEKLDKSLYSELELAKIDTDTRADVNWIRKLELLAKGEYIYI